MYTADIKSCLEILKNGDFILGMFFTRFSIISLYGGRVCILMSVVEIFVSNVCHYSEVRAKVCHRKD